MKRNTILGAFGIALVVMLAGSGSPNNLFCFQSIAHASELNNNILKMAKSPVDSIDERLKKVNNQLGFRLLTHLFNSQQQQNIFISPTSIAIALGMTYNGASGTTQQAMARALGLEGLSLKDINLGYQKLQTNLQQAEPDLQLSIANSLWANREISFKHQFLKNNREFYQAQVTNLDFNNFQSKNIINSWVREATNQKIRQIVDSINPDDVLFLINAVYFKGNWHQQFEANLTGEKPFYLSANFAKPQPMMSQTGEYSYYENEQFQAVSLPYEQKRLSMYIFLPKPDNDLAALSQQLTNENWEEWMKQFRRQEGSLQIPRFKLEYGVDLDRAIAALGMGIIFDGDRASFEAMTSKPVAIDQIKHKTFVEVNEEGTEAAGVTSVGVRVTSAMETKPFEMVVDRPFFCAIKDEQTGTILFMGAIVDPT
jgi:serpin B